MASLKHPVLFSQEFDCTSEHFSNAGLIEPILNIDTRLFIDPTLIETSSNNVMLEIGVTQLIDGFQNIIKLVDASERENDLAWKGARRLLDISECSETGLGYGGSRTTGSSRPNEMRDAILRSIIDLIRLGKKDPSILKLVGLFEEGVGPDTISDFAGHCIYNALVKISADFYENHRLPTTTFPVLDNAKLVVNPYQKNKPILLVPQDIVRHLPLATDWSDVQHAIDQVEEIRDRFNAFFIGVVHPTITEKKRALRSVAMESQDNLQAITDALLAEVGNYDPNKDVFNYYAIREILSGRRDSNIPEYVGPKEASLDNLKTVVVDIIEHFRHQIENNNLWELLWNNDKPKYERAVQLAFFAVADVFCKANNMDISPETNMGGGPVDFKFSSGYNARVIVEFKKSTGTVVHGYKTQLEIYKSAAATEVGIFVVVDVGGLGKKLLTIQRERDRLIESGQSASDIYLIDAKRRQSASKS